MVEYISVFIILPETVGRSCLQACTLWAFQKSIKRNDYSKKISLMLEPVHSPMTSTHEAARTRIP